MKSPYQGSNDLIKNRDSSGIDGSDVVAVLSILNISPPEIDMIICKSWGCNPKLLLFFGVGYSGEIFGQHEQLPRNVIPRMST